MKKNLILLVLTGIVSICFGQKKIIDPKLDTHFPFVSNPIISDNGEYVGYTECSYSKNVLNTNLLLVSTRAFWRMEFKNVKNETPSITSDSRLCIFSTLNDTLKIAELGKNQVKSISGVSFFSTPAYQFREWIVYQLIDRKEELVLLNLKTFKTRSFSNVINSWWNRNGECIILQRAFKKNAEKLILRELNASLDDSTVLCEGNYYDNIVFDPENTQLAFKDHNSIWYFKSGMPRAVKLFDVSKFDDFILDSCTLNNFSRDGKLLNIEILKPDTSPIEKKGIRIMSFADPVVQQVAAYGFSQSVSYQAAIRLDNGHMLHLQKYKGEDFYRSSKNIILTSYQKEEGDYNSERIWNKSARKEFSIIDATNGKREVLDWINNIDCRNPKLSPSGRFIVFYDYGNKDYYSYEIATKKIRNLTEKISTSWIRRADDHVFSMARGIAGWSTSCDVVFIYDTYDVWKIDLQGKSPSINLTNGYGLKHKLIFNLSLSNTFDDGSGQIKKNEVLLLSTFDINNKNNGFFQKAINAAGDPKLLTMGSYLYKITSPNAIGLFDFAPIKARNANVYLFRRMSSTEAPNFYTTTDFKTFRKISNLEPEKAFNWYSTELHEWKSLDGNVLQGILYKPEDFDKNKKYPVIFYLYEKLSDGLNAYLTPEVSGGPINIPTYVSNGYLVFTPDIYYEVGNPMQGAYNAVVSAVNHISGFSFVDKKRIGIQGHSFGAGQTNYLITKTNLFSAACSSSGIASWISNYSTEPAKFEFGQYRVGSSLWEAPDSYIRSSPIFHLQKVSTPLLIKHGEKDEACPYSNAMELFRGLRRLGKKVWMAAYVHGGHVLDGHDSEDFNIRMMQFFDYYLKDGPAPDWMFGRSCPHGLLTPKEQQRVDSLVIRKPISIIIY